MVDTVQFQALVGAFGHASVAEVARRIREGNIDSNLVAALEMGRALAELSGDKRTAAALRAEIEGYDAVGIEVPRERKVAGFASPFAVRALRMLDPEEIFLANREKFSQVTLTIGQPIRELEVALQQIESGGVLALQVPASEVSGEAALTDPDVEVYIYILPREIERIINAARQQALNAMVGRIVDGLAGPRIEAEMTDPSVPVAALEDTDVHRLVKKPRVDSPDEGDEDTAAEVQA